MTLAVAQSEHLVPEESAIAMIETCAAQIERASTIPDVKRVLSHAEAINAVMQKIKASERTKLAALRLLVDAERQLGRLTKTIPQGKRGAGAVPGQRTKRQVLAEHGLNRFRCSVAEKYAATPTQAIDAAIGRVESRTIHGVSVALGFKKPFLPDHRTPEQTVRDFDFLANEAIELLERCIASQRAPHAGTVAEMRGRLSRLRVRA